MKRFTFLAVVLLTLGWITSHVTTQAVAQSAGVQVATIQTATLKIENMTCALCPVTVKKAMEGVEGVKSVAIDFDAKTATVIFDPSVTAADTIAAASTDIGYPASVQG